MTKIVDIISPRENKNDPVMVQKKIKPKKSFKSLKITIFTLFIFVLAGLYVYCMDGEAQVTVYPVTKQIGLEESITIVATEAKINIENNIIPAEYFEDTVEFTAYYDATGSDESGQKAEGTITVFSEYSKDVKITNNTRFITSQGLLFRSKQAFTVPANGEVDVEVYAVKAGEEYNLKKAVFSIPGLATCCSAIYENVHAEIKEETEISGGKSSVVKVVLEEDIDNAEKDFKKNYLEEAKNTLIKSIDSAGSYMYFEEDIEQEFTQFIINASVGDKPESGKFEVMGIIKTRILGFREADVDKFIEEKLSLSEQGLILVPQSLEKDFSKEQGEIILTANAYTYPKINKIFLLNDVKGLELSDCKLMLEAMNEIRSADIVASLFWKKRLPINRDNINLNINFEIQE